MTADQFRKLALGLADTGERSHMKHPDFRVRGNILATLTAAVDAEFGMVKLTPEEQQNYPDAAPDLHRGEWSVGASGMHDGPAEGGEGSAGEEGDGVGVGDAAREREVKQNS
jgi:hypothetical protein